MEDKMTIGKRIKQLREGLYLNQEELAEKAGISRSALANYESGLREPKGVILVRLAEALETSSDYLLGLTNDPTPPIMSDTRVKRIVGELAQPVLDDDALECLDQLHKRPEMKTLFQVSKHATREDIETAITIIEALRKKKGD